MSKIDPVEAINLINKTKDWLQQQKPLPSEFVDVLNITMKKIAKDKPSKERF